MLPPHTPLSNDDDASFLRLVEPAHPRTLFLRTSLLCAVGTYTYYSVYTCVYVWAQEATAAAKRFEFLQRGDAVCVRV